MKTDIQIAQEAKGTHQGCGGTGRNEENELEFYGKYKAKTFR